MTPEALAEINHHTDVIRVLRVWEHLQRQESSARLSSLGDEAEQVDLSSPTASTSGAQGNDEPEPSLRYGSLGSRKGKERAFSFSSNVSDTGSTTAIKVKQSFEALFRGRASRSASITSIHQPEGTSPTSPMLAGLRISTKNDGNLRIDVDNAPVSPLAFSPPTSPSAPYGPDGSSLNREASGFSGYSGQSTTTLGLNQMFPDPPDRELSSSNLASSPSRSTTGPSPSRITAGPPPSRSNSNIFGSSRRPSLPAILEKAAHPGQAIRHAFRRDRDATPGTRRKGSQEPNSPSSPDSVFSSASRSPPSQSAFRGRQADYNVSPESQRGRRYGRRYMSKHALIHLFRRGQSPPSRSPSPPQRTEAKKTLLPEELDEGIEKLRAASLDLDMRQGVVKDAEERSIFSDQGYMPTSAPVHKTNFFDGDFSIPTFSSLSALSVDPALIPLPPSPSSSTLASDISENKLSPISVPERRRTISRKGSGAAVPSPLANEWAQSSDSDSPSARIKRSKSDLVKSTSQSTITSPTGSSSVQPSTPSSPLQSEYTNTQGSKPRSATLPSSAAPNLGASVPRSNSSGRIMGLGWSDGMDLRKVASGILRRRSTRSRKRSDPKSPTKLTEDVRSGRVKIQRVSEEKDATPEGEQAETETIKAGPSAEGKQSQDSGRTERPADADGEDEDEEYHDAEDASIFDYTEYIRFAEPLDVDFSSSDRPSTPVVVVQSPVDETGSATVEVIHTPTEEYVDPALLQSQLAPGDLVTRLEAREVSDEGTTDTEKGEKEPERATSEETERGDTDKPGEPDATRIPIPPSTTSTPPIEEKQESDAKPTIDHAPTPQRKITPPRSRFVEIIAPEDIQPVQRQHTYRSWARFGRHRGASLGTTTDATDSTRIVTPPSMRISLGSSDSLGQSPPSHKRVATIKTSPPAPPPSILSNIENRARGKSVSSTSTSTSGQGYSYGHSGSTAGTSLTPPSTLSLGAVQGGFPPVPEHDVVHPQPRRKASTSAEARELIKQTESDILQIAQLPESLDSSRSLAAQLASYGESHAMEEVFAEREKQRWVGSDGGDSDRDSYFSALSEGASKVPSEIGSERPRRPSSINSFGRRSEHNSKHPVEADPHLGYGPSMLSVDAPHSASINTIYDKRAAAYKERMAALTSAPSQTFSSASSTHSRRHYQARILAARASSPMSTDSWLDAGSARLVNPEGDATPRESTDLHPRISSPLPVSSSQTHVARTARKTSLPVVSSRQMSPKPASMLAPSVIRSTRSVSPTISRFGAASFSGVTPLSLNPSRYAGLTAPMQSLGSVGAAAARSPSITSGFSGMAMSAGSSPYISIFSNRFTGPHDGDDSDDEEEAQQQYMVIENDWMGGHVVEPEGDKRKKWGQLREAFGTGKPKK